MRNVLFQAVRTIGKDDKGNDIKKKETTNVVVPETVEEAVALFSTFKPLQVTIGYNIDGSRIRAVLPFLNAMAIEGYKLWKGKEIAPEAAEETDEELDDALATLPEEKLVWVEEMLSYAKGKKKVELRAKILAGGFN